MKKIISLFLSIVIVFSFLVIPASAAGDKQGVEDFVTRLYDICLDRQPDPSGFRDWTEQLEDGTNTGVGCAYGFIFSPEFQNKPISNDQYVELMYNCFFGRASDPAGKADWLSKMNAGMSREELFCGFANSVEFFELCSSYGIIAGFHIAGKDYQKIAKINLFVERLYRIILGRNCDQSGMADWSTRLVNRDISGAEAAYGFIFSSEYREKSKTDKEFVTDLYQGFLGREPDFAGLATWRELLSTGSSDLDIFNGFAGSQEWIEICNSYGIEAGGNVSGEQYARIYIGTVISEDNVIIIAPTPTPVISRWEHSFKKVATYEGISFAEVLTYDNYFNQVSDAFSHTSIEYYGEDGTCSDKYAKISQVIYVSDTISTSDLYIKHNGDEGFRDFGNSYTQYIPDCASPNTISYINYYEADSIQISSESYEYMSQNGYSKYIIVTIELSEPGLQKFDLYYKGHKIRTIEYDNDSSGSLVYLGDAEKILSDVTQYKTPMTDLEILSAASYWIRNHSYRDYTCWGCHQVEAVMLLLGYSGWTMSCSYLDDDGTLYNDYGNYYSLSRANVNEHSGGHRISMVLIDQSHYVFVQVQGSQALEKGETDFSKPWVPFEPQLSSIYDKVTFMRDYDTVYDMVLGDYGVDLKTFDPYDCSTWY